MPKINVTTREGSTHEVTGDAGATLMEILRDADMGVAAICGGVCSCATCHVYIDPAWAGKIAPRSEDENDLLKELESFRPEMSRLSCQVEFTADMDGVVVEVAPDE